MRQSQLTIVIQKVKRNQSTSSTGEDIAVSSRNVATYIAK